MSMSAALERRTLADGCLLWNMLSLHIMAMNNESEE
jgi:hypothetical protein